MEGGSDDLEVRKLCRGTRERLSVGSGLGLSHPGESVERRLSSVSQ